VVASFGKDRLQPLLNNTRQNLQDQSIAGRPDCDGFAIRQRHLFLHVQLIIAQPKLIHDGISSIDPRTAAEIPDI